MTSSMVTAYQSAYQAELTRMRKLGHAESFCQMAALQYAQRHLILEVRR